MLLLCKSNFSSEIDCAAKDQQKADVIIQQSPCKNPDLNAVFWVVKPVVEMGLC